MIVFLIYLHLMTVLIYSEEIFEILKKIGDESLTSINIMLVYFLINMSFNLLIVAIS